MRTEILLLTRSDMFGGLCVAGINLMDGKWIRLKMDGYDSIPINQFRYSNGKTPELMDIISIEISRKKVCTQIQPENKLLENNVFSKVGVGNINMLSKRIKEDVSKDYIFHSQSYLITDEELNSVPDNKRYSLMVIKPEKLRFTWYPGDKKRKLKAYFRYNGNNYGGFPVTDLAFKEEVQNRPNYKEFSICNRLLVISLAEDNKFSEEYSGKHFKLVASVL